MPKHRIEIIGLDGKKFYSIGCVEITDNNEVYIVFKGKDGVVKFTRHRSGKSHIQIIDAESGKVTRRDTEPKPAIEEMKNSERIVTQILFSRQFDELFNEYKLKKGKGIFCIDLRAYTKGAFYLSVSIVRKNSFSDILNTVVETENRQVYIYAESDPMLALFAFSPIILKNGGLEDA